MEVLNELEQFKADAEGNRNTRIVDLIEGDILVNGDELSHVTAGEIAIYADGTIDVSRGELAPIERDAVGYAIAAGRTIFDMEDI